MSKYTGSQCIICQKLFEEGDDVVVCPDCGTPYHRSCYAAKGRCVNVSLHESGKSWQAVHDEQQKRLGGRECPVCRHMNPPEAETCGVCRLPLRQEAPPQEQQQQPDGPQVMITEDGEHFFNAMDPCCGMSPEEELDGERLGDVAEFVRSNTLYYIPLFKRFSQKGHKLSLNIPCIFFPHLYFANRKMWLMTIVTVLLSVICNIPAFLLNIQEVFRTPDMISVLKELYGPEMLSAFDGLLNFVGTNKIIIQQCNTVMFIVDLAVHLLLCFGANWLYYRFVLRRVRRVRQSGASENLRKAILQTGGGVSLWNMLGAIAIYYGVSMVLYTAAVMLLM